MKGAGLLRKAFAEKGVDVRPVVGQQCAWAMLTEWADIRIHRPFGDDVGDKPFFKPHGFVRGHKVVVGYDVNIQVADLTNGDGKLLLGVGFLQ